MSLETVSKLVASHSTPSELKIQQATSEKALLQEMFKWISWGFLVLGIGVFLLVTNKSLALGKLVGLAASFLLLAGTGMATYGVLRAIRQGISLAGSQPPKTIESEPTKQLREERAPALTSVTERTTELINPPDAKGS